MQIYVIIKLLLLYIISLSANYTSKYHVMIMIMHMHIHVHFDIQHAGDEFRDVNTLATTECNLERRR